MRATAEEGEEETGESGSSKGGYSADCSASDQSSSDDGPQKPRQRRDSGKTSDTTTTAPKLPLPQQKQQELSATSGLNESAVEPNMSNVAPAMASSTLPNVTKDSAQPLYAFEFKSSFFPQWNGVSISNPLDPRIDFSNVNVQQQQATVFDAAARMLPQQFVPTRTASSVPSSVQQPSQQQQMDGQNPEQSFSVEQYTQLLEAVRPFFFTQAGLPPMMQQQQQPSSGVTPQDDPTPGDPPSPKDGGGSSSTGPSSEGFTAFFTTTDASAQNNSNNDENNNNKAGSSETSDSNNNRQQQQQPQPNDDDDDADTTASMEVLARPRHKKQQDDRRVRIHEGDDTRTRRVVTDSARTTSGSGGGSNPGSSTSLNDQGGSTDDRKTESGNKPEGPQAAAHVQRSMVWDKTPIQQADARERKLLDKKRKRIEMRREYEAQQQFESSESSDPRLGEFFRPGKPLALDQAIVFSSIPRIIIHSSPPFLVVHSNAAFCRLTGIDSHVVEGEPVSSLLSVTPGDIPDLPHVHQHYNPAAVEDAENFRLSPRTDLERLLVTCGYGHLRVVQVQTQAAPTKPVRMLGRNVIIKGSGDVAAGGKKDEESNNSTSLSSSTAGVNDTTNNNEGAKNKDKILCKVSIAPIISTVNSGALHGADGQATMKRLRQSNGTDQHVSHFVIQFEPKAGEDSGGSISSASLAVRNSNNAAAANVLQMHHHTGSTSESSQALAAVA